MSKWHDGENGKFQVRSASVSWVSFFFAAEFLTRRAVVLAHFHASPNRVVCSGRWTTPPIRLGPSELHLSRPKALFGGC